MQNAKKQINRKINDNDRGKWWHDDRTKNIVECKSGLNDMIQFRIKNILTL